MRYQVYAGAYTDKENQDGIFQLELDTEKETLRIVRTYRECDSPSFLAVTPDYLYAVSEREDSNEGMVSAYRRNRENGELHFIRLFMTAYGIN